MPDQPNNDLLPLTPQGGGARILGRRFQNWLITVLNSHRILRVSVPYTDGTNILNSKDAEIKTSILGTVIKMPAIQLGGAGTPGRASVPFSGNGAPSSSTLSAANNYLAGPVPSLYVDMVATALYVCTGAGTNVTSTWAKISGGVGGGFSIWNPGTAYTPGMVSMILNTATYNGILIQAGTYGCLVAVPASPSGNQIPQFPEPFGNDANYNPVCWRLIAFGPQGTTQCGQAVSGYVNATGPINT